MRSRSASSAHPAMADVGRRSRSGPRPRLRGRHPRSAGRGTYDDDAWVGVSSSLDIRLALRPALASDETSEGRHAQEPHALPACAPAARSGRLSFPGQLPDLSIPRRRVRDRASRRCVAGVRRGPPADAGAGDHRPSLHPAAGGGGRPRPSERAGRLISASRIADVTGIPRQTVRRKLAALEARGWVERTRSATYSLVVTPEGSPAGRDLGEIDRRSIERVARLFCSLSSLLARAEAPA